MAHGPDVKDDMDSFVEAVNMPCSPPPRKSSGYSRSRMVAAPWPTPMHMVASP